MAYTTPGAPEFFFQGGGKFQKKGTPAKVDYSNHVAIKLAYSLKKKKVFTCSRSPIFLFSPQNHSVL